MKGLKDNTANLCKKQKIAKITDMYKILVKIISTLFLTGGCFLLNAENIFCYNEWLSAIETNGTENALNSAKKITGKIFYANINKTSEIVLKLCLKNGIKPEYITTDFNAWDFEYWQRAYFLHNLSKKLTHNLNLKTDNKIIKKLFNSVHERIKHINLNKEANRLWPDAVWKNAEGMCDSESWLLAELAYQAGFETMIIYLKNPTDDISPHTLCEIRKEEKVWICDPFYGSIMSNTSFGDLVSDKDKLNKFWPDKILWKQSTNQAEFWLPSYIQDYCPRNQILRKKLSENPIKEYPSFGENPFARFFKYIKLLGKNDKKYSYGLWFFPFRLQGVVFNQK